MKMEEISFSQVSTFLSLLQLKTVEELSMSEHGLYSLKTASFGLVSKGQFALVARWSLTVGLASQLTLRRFFVTFPCRCQWKAMTQLFHILNHSTTMRGSIDVGY